MSDQTKWFSQTLLTFKDKEYATDGYLRLSISTNTEDYKFFNPPMINISISNANKYQKTANLNIQNAEDLVESFDKLIKQQNGNGSAIEKHYNKFSKLFFNFTVSSSTNERVVIIEIYSNDSDAVKVIIPAKPIFQSFLKRLRYFVDKYDKICMSLLTQTINYESTQIIQQLPGLIKGISSQIIDQDIILDSRAPEQESPEVAEMETTTYDFDKFLGEDMENIKVPELENEFIEEKQAERLIEVESPFVDRVLKNDLSNLESKLSSFTVANNPVLDLANDLLNQLNFSPLENIDNDDKKSICYLSKLMMDIYSKAYTIHNEPIPSKTTVFKFDGKPTDEKLDLAKDILTIIGYMRIFTQRMETKIENAYDSKALFYMYIRYMMDSFAFSYVSNMTHSEITSAIVTRYKYFDSIGVFDVYKTLLKDNNCSPISTTDIDAFAEQVYDNIRKTPFVDKIHDMMYEGQNVKLPSKNTFDLEQIINEIIPLEVHLRLGFDFEDEGAVLKLKESGISDEMINFFKGNKKVEKKSVMRKITPLQRAINKFKQDIPEELRDEVINHIKDLEYNKFDFSKCTWPLQEFDPRVIVSLYVWDPENDKRMKTDFSHFMSLVETEQMTKDDIIIAMEELNKESESFGFEDINFEM